MNTIVSVIIFIILLVLVGWLVKKIFFSGKSKDPKQEEAKDNVADKEVEQISSKLIKVIIFRKMGGSLVSQVGDPIICEEKRDENNNLLVINDVKHFKEDFSFPIDRIYETMNFSLELEGKSKTVKKEYLNKAIKVQETLILEIEADVTENANYNINDERVKLRQLKVLKNSIDREKKGNYMRLGKGGVRQYELVSIDGILVPYFFGSNLYTVYPDLTRKFKIFNHENTVFRNETSAMQAGILNWMIVILLIAGVVLTISGSALTYHAYFKNTQVTENANEGNIRCSNTLATMTEYAGEEFIDYIKWRREQSTANNINTEDPNNSIVDIGSVIIDPTNINR